MLCLYRDKAELKPNKLVAAWMEILFSFWLNFVSSDQCFFSNKITSSFFWQNIGKLLGIFVEGNITSTVLGICKISTSQNWEKACFCLHHDWIFLLLLEIVNGTLVPENAMETQDTNVFSNGLPEILATVNVYSYLWPTIGKLIGE